MPYINFKNVKEPSSNNNLPCGKYLALIRGIEVKNTQIGDEMWVINLFIQSGKFYAHEIQDRMVFNEKGFQRIKKLYKACGLVDLLETNHNCIPSDINNRQLMIKIDQKQEIYEGKKFIRSYIEWAGYESDEEYREEFDKFLFNKKLDVSTDELIGTDEIPF